MTGMPHPTDSQLAQLDEWPTMATMIGQHARACGRCRGTLAEYRWLRDEMSALFAGVAEAAAVPRPMWEQIGRSTSRKRRRHLFGLYCSATACVAVVLCLAFATPRTGGAPVVADRTASARLLEVRETAPRAVSGAAALCPPAMSPTPTPAPPTGYERDQGAAPSPEPIPTAPRVAAG